MNREWITPFVAGSFLLIAATGILIFFHVDSGANKFVHEWLSWALVAGVALHIVLNFKALKKHLSAPRGLLIAGAFIAILGGSFVVSGEKDEPPFMRPVQALAQVPLTTLAQVCNVSPQELRQRLAKAGIQATSDQQKLSDLIGNDGKKQMHVLNELLGEKK